MFVRYIIHRGVGDRNSACCVPLGVLGMGGRGGKVRVWLQALWERFWFGLVGKVMVRVIGLWLCLWSGLVGMVMVWLRG